jgi:hypothetical protein
MIETISDPHVDNDEDKEEKPDLLEPAYLCAYCDKSFFYEMPMHVHMLKHEKEMLQEEEKAAKTAAGTF